MDMDGFPPFAMKRYISMGEVEKNAQLLALHNY